MKKPIQTIIIAFALFPLSACAPQSQKVAVPLEIQAIQKRDFETTKKIAFSSVVSVLQDLGYIIDNADFETGLITANSPSVDSTNFWTWRPFAGLAGVASNAVASKTRVSVYAEEISANFTSIRMNFVSRQTTSLTAGGTESRDTPILVPEVYIEAFNKIENAIFIRS